MRRVAALLAGDDPLQALLRMWVLSQAREGENSALNRWERNRAPKEAFDRQVRDFVKRLQTGPDLSDGELADAPLAALRAIDRVAHDSLPETPPSGPLEEAGRKYWLIRAHGRSLPLARQAGCVEHWMTHHRVIPTRSAFDVGVQVCVAVGRTAEALAEVGARSPRGLRIWIGHVPDDARLEWTASASRTFRLTGVKPEQVRQASLRDTFERASTEGADILLLPEFTVDLTARRVIAQWLRQNPHPFLLVVAGSFHEDTAQGWFNTAELWDHSARVLLTHRKLRLFGDIDQITEDVSEGNHVSVLMTPIGSMTVLICKDFMDEHQRVASLLREVPVDWVLVPSYGDDKTSLAHERRAESLARVGPGTTSILATQRNVEVTAGAHLPGFVVCCETGHKLAVPADGGLVTVVNDGGTRSGLKRVK